jgi:hypothetical protein
VFKKDKSIVTTKPFTEESVHLLMKRIADSEPVEVRSMEPTLRI